MSTIYTRRDYGIHVLEDGGDAVLTIDAPEGTRLLARRFRRDALDDASKGRGGRIPRELSRAIGAALSRASPRPSSGTLNRIAVEVGVREWAALAWESLCSRGLSVIRISPVRPRVLQIHLTFPIRVLETGPRRIVPAAIEATFRGTAREHAYIEGHTSLSDAPEFAQRASWATVDVLHVHDLPSSEPLLTNARESAAGTTGWLLRFADRFQTRLIILDKWRRDPRDLRRMAQTIIDRGGPAVLLLSRASHASRILYKEVAHDRPLDWILTHLSDSELSVGRGGEEALRYSVLARELSKSGVSSSIVTAYAPNVAPQRRRPLTAAVEVAVKTALHEAGRAMGAIDAAQVRFDRLWGTRAQRFGDSVAAKLPRHGIVATNLGSQFDRLRERGKALSIDEVARTVVAKSVPLHSLKREQARDILSTKLRDIGRSAATYQYESHESEGMLPLSAKIEELRSFVTAVHEPKKSRRRAPRDVNAAFYAMGSEGTLNKVPQAHARLRTDEVIHLGVRIAPKDDEVVSLGPTTFVEERVLWKHEGAWLELGVTGIDFEVIGDPVQQFFLPREHSSGLVTFALRPRQPTTMRGVARLRFTLYQQDNILQSFFVVAALLGAPDNIRSAMARALGVSASEARKIGNAGYIARLEYATASLAEAPRATPRALSVLVNESAGDKVVTVKGDDLFRVKRDDISDLVGAARQTLLAASRRGVAYRYETFANEKNAGDPKDLCDALSAIADAGWQIYNALLPDPDDQDRVRSLIEGGRGIHAAHIDFSNVIPWSMIYDRPVFFGGAVVPTVCRASMPNAKGEMPNVECGGAGCVLDPATTGSPAASADAVICPRRFWGFMFSIDVPAQKLDGIGQKSTPLAEEIKNQGLLSILAGYNEKLDFGRAHVESLRADILKQTSTAQFKVETGRASVRALVKEVDPDIVYLYCHALARTLGKDGKDRGAALDFGMGFKGIFDNILFPADFGGRPAWSHSPLVFLNGCGTVGFDPYAPSRFIKQFIQGKHAGAVVGTETTIVEMLATEVGKSFLQALLAGASAGDALLLARRSLLAKNNPLGLMYTLYGSARLRLKVVP